MEVVSTYMTNNIKGSLHLPEVTEADLIKIIKSRGTDDMAPFILKVCALNFVESLLEILNKLLENGKLPF